MLARCLNSAEAVFERCLRCFQGTARVLKGFLLMLHSSVIVFVRFVISCIGISFIQLLRSFGDVPRFWMDSF